MKRVYTTDGATIKIGSYGFATGTVPAEVPDEVAAELRREGHKRYRIEDDEPPKTATASAPAAPAQPAEKGKEL